MVILCEVHLSLRPQALRCGGVNRNKWCSIVCAHVPHCFVPHMTLSCSMSLCRLSRISSICRASSSLQAVPNGTPPAGGWPVYVDFLAQPYIAGGYPGFGPDETCGNGWVPPSNGWGPSPPDSCMDLLGAECPRFVSTTTYHPYYFVVLAQVQGFGAGRSVGLGNPCTALWPLKVNAASSEIDTSEFFHVNILQPKVPGHGRPCWGDGVCGVLPGAWRENCRRQLPE
jgi:hypothetical protein